MMTLIIQSILLNAAGNELSEKIYQSIQEYSSFHAKKINRRLPLEVKVVPFESEESYKGENIGHLAAELIIKYLRDDDRLRTRPMLLTKQDAKKENIPDEEMIINRPSQWLISGSVQRQGDLYNIRMFFYDARNKEELGMQELLLPSPKFHRLLRRYYHWKHQTLVFQPYLQAMYSERYLTQYYPEQTIVHNYYETVDSFLVRPNQISIDENAEFIGGGRLVYHRWLMLDLSYEFHSYSTTENQSAFSLINIKDTKYRSSLALNISTSAVTGSINAMALLYGDLRGYSGLGLERISAHYSLSGSCKLYFSGPHSGLINVHSYFLTPGDPSPTGALSEGGRVVQRSIVPFIRLGFEWRPKRFGFNFLVHYRLGDGDFAPLMVGVEEIYNSSWQSNQRISYTIIPTSKYRLPRFSIGAAFIYTL